MPEFSPEVTHAIKAVQVGLGITENTPTHGGIQGALATKWSEAAIVEWYRQHCGVFGTAGQLSPDVAAREAKAYAFFQHGLDENALMADVRKEAAPKPPKPTVNPDDAAHGSSAAQDVITLRGQVTTLTARVEQLIAALRKNGIPIPDDPPVEVPIPGTGPGGTPGVSQS